MSLCMYQHIIQMRKDVVAIFNKSYNNQRVPLKYMKEMLFLNTQKDTECYLLHFHNLQTSKKDKKVLFGYKNRIENHELPPKPKTSPLYDNPFPFLTNSNYLNRRLKLYKNKDLILHILPELSSSTSPSDGLYPTPSLKTSNTTSSMPFPMDVLPPPSPFTSLRSSFGKIITSSPSTPPLSLSKDKLDKSSDKSTSLPLSAPFPSLPTPPLPSSSFFPALTPPSFTDQPSLNKPTAVSFNIPFANPPSSQTNPSDTLPAPSFNLPNIFEDKEGTRAPATPYPPSHSSKLEEQPSPAIPVWGDHSSTQFADNFFAFPPPSSGPAPDFASILPKDSLFASVCFFPSLPFPPLPSNAILLIFLIHSFISFCNSFFPSPFPFIVSFFPPFRSPSRPLLVLSSFSLSFGKIKRK